MDPITYSLCHKPVLGLVMLVASACGFPPLFYQVPFDLRQEGARLVRDFSAPVGKPYSLVLHFHFPDAADSLADQIVGARHDRACGVLRYEEMATGQRHELGRPMPVHVLVRNRQSGAVVVDKAVETLCLRSRGGEPGFVKTRTVTTLPLAVGTYTIELRNLAGQAGLEDVPTTVSLVPGAK